VEAALLHIFAAMAASRSGIEIPVNEVQATLRVGQRTVSLTNLQKVFWPDSRVTKRDLLQYYADIGAILVPHLRDRAMVMKRYPNGVRGKCFFMKRAPSPRPEWIRTCSIEHGSGSIIDFPMAQDVASILWLVNLGCVDLNQWYSRCDDINRPDYLHFDLDPVDGTPFSRVRDVALLVGEALSTLGMKSFAKTTGASGIHIYVPIVRGPLQKQVWTFAKALARNLEEKHPKLVTAEYRIAKRPKGRVLVDYNQNAWGKTLASVYSVRPQRIPTVSTPVTWEEIEDGIEIEDFTIENVPARVAKLGDLWSPLNAAKGRFRLEALL
jgi:bifunctional non-homologous end joining protein LigD